MLKLNYKKIPLERRIQISFIVSIILVTIIWILSFRYFTLIDREINDLLGVKDNPTELEKHRSIIETLPEKAIKDMTTITFFTILGGILLGIIFPRNIMFPLKKFYAAIEEVRNCNLNAKMELDKDDEFYQLAEEINKLLAQIKHFDELKSERILLDKQKFDLLSDMIDKNLILCDKERKIHYMNNQTYNLFGLTTSVINKDISESGLPLEIIDYIEHSLSKDEKIQKHQTKIKDRKEERLIEIESALVRNKEGVTEFIILVFKVIDEPNI